MRKLKKEEEGKSLILESLRKMKPRVQKDRSNIVNLGPKGEEKRYLEEGGESGGKGRGKGGKSKVRRGWADIENQEIKAKKENPDHQGRYKD